MKLIETQRKKTNHQNAKEKKISYSNHLSTKLYFKSKRKYFLFQCTIHKTQKLIFLKIFIREANDFFRLKYDLRQVQEINICREEYTSQFFLSK